MNVGKNRLSLSEPLEEIIELNSTAMILPKYSLSKSAFPPEVVRMLRELGEGLRIARLRRRQSQVDFAERLMVSRATLQRMERGDPSVALGAWVSAAWLLQRLSDLQHVFDPDFDEAGKRMERRYLPTRGKKSQTIRLGRSNELNNDF